VTNKTEKDRSVDAEAKVLSEDEKRRREM